jgi:hypothetical protein
VGNFGLKAKPFLNPFFTPRQDRMKKKHLTLLLLFKLCNDICKSSCTTGVNFTSGKLTNYWLTPVANLPSVLLMRTSFPRFTLIVAENVPLVLVMHAGKFSVGIYVPCQIGLTCFSTASKISAAHYDDGVSHDCHSLKRGMVLGEHAPPPPEMLLQ